MATDDDFMFGLKCLTAVIVIWAAMLMVDTFAAPVIPLAPWAFPPPLDTAEADILAWALNACAPTSGCYAARKAGMTAIFNGGGGHMATGNEGAGAG